MDAYPLQQPLSYDQAQALTGLDDELEAAVARVAKLDFRMLRQKLAEERLWSEETCDEVESLYRKFLALNARYPDRKICPTGPIDDFWHAHILDTRAYAQDCENALGRFLHHFPYFGMRGPEDRADLDRTFAASVGLFIRHFGIDPTAGDSLPRGCRAQRCP